MWVYAPAGYGKTAVAGTVAGKLEANLFKEPDCNPLGGTFFFWRTSTDRNSPARFITTLTYQLFISIPELAPHIENSVKRDPAVLCKALEVQLMKLIVEPFKALGDTRDMPNRLIIIDGLDECINSDRESRAQKEYAEDREKVQIRVLDLISVLASYRFPLSFLILSRPEVWIKQHIGSPKFAGLVELVDLCEVGDNMNDVEKYLRAELSRLGLSDDEELLKGLVAHAGGHILYASTVIRHIDDPYCDPRCRLESLLSKSSHYFNPDLTHSTSFSPLSELYRQILRSCPKEHSQLMIEVLDELMNPFTEFNFELNLAQVVAILDRLSGREPGSGMRAIRGLHSVLRLGNLTGNDPGATDYFIHSSFPDFLKNPRLSLEFTVHGGKAPERLLSGCLDCISSITLTDSRPPGELEPHVRYALHCWPSIWLSFSARLWWEGGGRGARITPTWRDMWQRLLDINLTNSFVQAFTIDVNGLTDPPTFFPLNMSQPSGDNCIIPSSDHNAYYSEPLAQQAVLHLVTSFAAAICHLLKDLVYGQGGFWRSDVFAAAVSSYLINQLDPEISDNWKHREDVVVQAIQTLWHEAPADFFALREDVVAWTRKHTIWARQMRSFFDHICPEDVCQV
ncbi:hypothetical protein MD484_g1052, partial [Candolleomyces efflorescens]